MTVTEGHLGRHEEGVELLNEYKTALLTLGFEQYRVDTLRCAGVEVRHHFSAGTWTLTATGGGDPIGKASWTVKPMPHRSSDQWPTVQELIQRTVGSAFADAYEATALSSFDGDGQPAA